MILQRIALGLRKHDWGMVLIEVLIVVVGILIGLQVDDWNEARKDRLDEQASLVRLLADLDQSITSLALERDDLVSWAKQTQGLVQGFGAGEAGRAQVKANEYGLLASTRVLIGRGQFATITELLESGRLGIIRNADIRAAIAATQGLAESRRLQIQVLSRQQAALVPFIRTQFRVAENRSAFEYDFGALSQDAQFLNSLSQAADSLHVNADWLNGVIGEMNALHEMVAEEIESDGD